jgi:F0F1-type ATP synthase assembly protein I
MKQQTPLSLFANVIVGLLLGLAANKYLHWSWAVPAGVLVGFVAGFLSMFRQLANQA